MQYVYVNSSNNVKPFHGTIFFKRVSLKIVEPLQWKTVNLRTEIKPFQLDQVKTCVRILKYCDLFFQRKRWKTLSFISYFVINFFLLYWITRINGRVAFQFCLPNFQSVNSLDLLESISWFEYVIDVCCEDDVPSDVMRCYASGWERLYCFDGEGSTMTIVFPAHLSLCPQQFAGLSKLPRNAPSGVTRILILIQYNNITIYSFILTCYYFNLLIILFII